MRRKLIITLNILFIVGAFYLLVEDYKRVGKFQWVDPNMIDDNEEVFLNPICVATIILGVVSILNQLIPRFNLDAQPGVKILVKFVFLPLCILYGAFSLLVGVTLVSMGAGNAGGGVVNNFKDVIFLFLLLVVFAGYALMGFLTLYQIYRDKNSS